MLSLTVVVPILFFSHKININHFSSSSDKEFLDDVNGIKFPADGLKLNAATQDIRDILKEPAGIVYKDGEYASIVSGKSLGNNSVEKDARKSNRSMEINETVSVNSGESQSKSVSVPSERKGQSNHVTGAQPNGLSATQQATDRKLREMKDQLITAKAFLNFAPPNSNSRLVKELRLQIKELERAIGGARKDSDLSKRALQRMKSMDVVLSKAARVYSDCSEMATKLRAMTLNTEEQVLAKRNEIRYLTRLAARTLPKGLHCLSMQLTTDYYSLQPEERKLPNKHRLQQKNLYHYVIFSDNVLACAVVVNSTMSTSLEPEKIVFHVVTDALSFPAITMWFLANPPGQATIQVQGVDDFKFLPSSYKSMLKQPNSRDPRFSSVFNHLRFHLPDIFPMLDKIVFLDHDVVVQRDLQGLWSVDMKGKVNGAVETCGDSEASHRMDSFINFSDPAIAKRFDVNACTWAFGMNVFDLREWRRRNLTSVYHKWLQLGMAKQLWKAGSLPLGLITFYNLTLPLHQQWHVVGLGYNPDLGQKQIERAAVIHYDGNMKPWLEIGFPRYRGYWNKFVKYDLPYLRQCNIHE